jgi:hypothetical protein
MTKLGRSEAFRSVTRRQCGRITWAQLAKLGIASATISTWVRSGYLTRVLPRVYAVGHDAPDPRADLWAAVLYAGPGAMLSHASAAHHMGLIDHPPRVVHVSTPRAKIRSVPGWVVVHARRERERRIGAGDGLPTTTIPQTLLDLACATTFEGAGPAEAKILRRALAVLDYRKQLDVDVLDALDAISRSGPRGSAALRRALVEYQPQHAHTNEGLEERFLELCVEWKVPLPLVNVWVHGELVDAYWPDHALVVELDGGHHARSAQLRRDRARDLALRRHGITVVRYDWDLVTRRPGETRGDLLRQLRAVSEKIGATDTIVR